MDNETKNEIQKIKQQVHSLFYQFHFFILGITGLLFIGFTHKSNLDFIGLYFGLVPYLTWVIALIVVLQMIGKLIQISKVESKNGRSDNAEFSPDKILLETIMLLIIITTASVLQHNFPSNYF